MVQETAKTMNMKKYALAKVGLGIMACVLFHQRARLFSKFKQMWYYNKPLKRKTIEVVETADACEPFVMKLRSQCKNLSVLGFDCEWVTTEGLRHPTALLQLASGDGLCVLFRLCCMKHVPKSLRDLLEDYDIIKVGVGPKDDAKKLSHDYGVGVAATLDLRFMACLAGHKPGGLAKMTKTYLNVELNKHWRIVCSDWEAIQLSPKQLEYAANDALVGIEIFKKLWDVLEPKRSVWRIKKDYSRVDQNLYCFLDQRFMEKLASSINSLQNYKATFNLSDPTQGPQHRKLSARKFSCIRSATPYDNCFLEAPDGSLLAAIDRKKAQWYISKHLANEIKADPLTVRLNFEPSGRPVGEVGLYNQTPKENQCVVCGSRDAYLRKNVVPREYRKYFPVLIKSHISHDVLLLCPTCHQLSNISDLAVRKRLAHLCDAPISQDPSVYDSDLKQLNKLRSMAKALLHHGDKIPVTKKNTMETLLKEHYAVADCTNEFLQSVLNMEVRTKVPDINANNHGAKVVEKFEKELGGLIELEKIWRTHFLETMKPKFLPLYWNINFTADRLEIRAQEGRVDKETLAAAGLKNLHSKKASVYDEHERTPSEMCDTLDDENESETTEDSADGETLQVV